MRLSSPRIAPADLNALTEAQRAVLEPLMGRRPGGWVDGRADG